MTKTNLALERMCDTIRTYCAWLPTTMRSDSLWAGKIRVLRYCAVCEAIRMVIPAQAKSSSTRIENRLGGMISFETSTTIRLDFLLIVGVSEKRESVGIVRP